MEQTIDIRFESIRYFIEALVIAASLFLAVTLLGNLTHLTTVSSTVAVPHTMELNWVSDTTWLKSW